MQTFSFSIQMAVESLFEGFQTSETVETAWARRLMSPPTLTDDEIAVEVSDAVATYCPNLPDEHIPMVIRILSTGIRAARHRERISVPGRYLSTAT
jgi:hypothetical protein